MSIDDTKIMIDIDNAAIRHYNDFETTYAIVSNTMFNNRYIHDDFYLKDENYNTRYYVIFLHLIDSLWTVSTTANVSVTITFEPISSDTIRCMVGYMNALLKQLSRERYSKMFTPSIIAADRLVTTRQLPEVSTTRQMIPVDLISRGTIPRLTYDLITMPSIVKIYYNAPNTVVKWSDGTITKVACSSNEKFDKETGLAMAISKKYYEMLGVEYPRAAFKKSVDSAVDQTEKTRIRREYKKSKKNKKVIFETEMPDGTIDINIVTPIEIESEE